MMRQLPVRAVVFAAVFLGVITLSAVNAPAAAFHEANECGGASGTPGIADFHSDNVEYVGGHNGFTGGHIFVDNEILYVGSYGIGFRMYDISDPANPVCLAEIHSTGLASADSVPDAAIFDGRTIVGLGGTGRIEGAPVPEANTDRTDFYDVTDPENPVHLWTLGPDQIDGEAHNADIFDEERLWLPSGGAGDRGFRIYDMEPLLAATPAEPTELWPGDTGLDPTELWEASPFRGDNEPVGDAFTHTHDITIYPNYEVEGLGQRDIILLAEGGAYLQGEPVAGGNTGSIFVIDITDPTDPVVLYRWLHDEEYDEGEDHHGIRYHHEVQFIDGQPNVMLVTDEDLHSTPGCLEHAAGFTAVQLTPDLQAGEELSEFFIPEIGPPAAVCSAHVFNSEQNYVFVGSYNAGLQIFDYSDPTAPVQAGFYIAEGATSWGAYYYDGYVYVGDVTRGLDVFQFDVAQASPPPSTDPSASPSVGASPSGGGQASPSPTRGSGSIPDTAGEWGSTASLSAVLLVLLFGSLLLIAGMRRR